MRNTLIITYDLTPTVDYTELYDFLEESGAFGVADSVWLLCTDENAETWYERIEEVFYDMSLIVLPLGDGTIGGTDDEVNEYLAGCDGEA